MYEIRECGNDCGWLFLKAAINSVFCNECGNNVLQPRICRVKELTTDWEVLLKLAKFTISQSPYAKLSLSDIVTQQIDTELQV